MGAKTYGQIIKAAQRHTFKVMKSDDEKTGVRLELCFDKQRRRNTGLKTNILPESGADNLLSVTLNPLSVNISITGGVSAGRGFRN
jgi:hypothetical protein